MRIYTNGHIGHNGLTVLRFPVLEEFDEVRHAVYARRGGLSREPYRSLNTSFGVGDDPVWVEGNRQKLQIAQDAAELIFCRQVHGSGVCVVSASADPEIQNRAATPPVCDALISAAPGKHLVIQVADCQPVLVYDPVRKSVGNIHSGWRGSIHNIIGRTISAMSENFGSRAKDLIAGIGPSLGPCCAEFVNYRREIPPPYWSYKIANDHFDFWALSRDQLVEAGLVPENIFVSDLCTRCRTDLFFSYRGEGRTGRFAAVIGMR
jgi:YfiH family protein